MKEALVDGGVLAINALVPGLSSRAVLQQVASAMRLPRRADPVSVTLRLSSAQHWRVCRQCSVLGDARWSCAFNP